MSKSQAHELDCIDSSDTSSDLIQVVTQLRDELSNLRAEVSDLEAEVSDLRAEVSDLEAENDSLRAEVSDLEAENDSLRAEVSDLEADLRADLEAEREMRGKSVAGVRQDLEDVRQERASPTPQAEETTIQPDELTPIEQLARHDEIEAVTDSPSVRRAVTLFQHLDDWGQKAPKGITLKPSDNPLSLLEAACNESLCWKQWYRTAEAVESLSEGAVTFFHSDKHGKMICLHEQSAVHDRVTSGALSVSSAATAP